MWRHWTLDLWILAPLAIAYWLYGRGLLCAWSRAGKGRIIPVWRAASFFAGGVVLIGALIAPLDPLGETLLAAHMMQHILLTAVAPPLLVLGLPSRAWIWALPHKWRSAGASPLVKAFARLMDVLCRPLTASLLHAGVIWLWHAPALFEAALADPAIHAMEHLSFLLTALLVWTAALRPGARPIIAAVIVLFTFMHSGMLGGLLTLAPVPLYDWYGDRARIWGLTPLEDQQVAGLAMWVIGGGLYLAAFAVLGLRAASSSSGRLFRMGAMRTSTSSRSMK